MKSRVDAILLSLDPLGGVSVAANGGSKSRSSRISLQSVFVDVYVGDCSYVVK